MDRKDEQVMDQHESPVVRELTAIRLLLEELVHPAPSAQRSSARSSRRRQAASFLRVVLMNGALTWAEIVEKGSEFNHSEHTLRRVRNEVADVAYRRGAASGEPPVWALKEEVRRDGA